MTVENITLSLSPPDVVQFIEFRERCGWGRIPNAVAESSLAAGLYNLSAWKNGDLVGFVRVVGDGFLYFYIQDLIVRHDMRGLGIGRELMDRLMRDLDDLVPNGGMIGLMSAKDKEHFYETFGFHKRPNSIFGAGMIYVV